MRPDRSLSRRSFVLGATAAVAAVPLSSCTPSGGEKAPSSDKSTPDPVDRYRTLDREPLWATACERGIVFGASAATWQLSDPAYRDLFRSEAAILLTEDDLLWYKLRPSPRSGLEFKHSDRIIDFAERSGMLVLGAHLVWDDGFGEGWSRDDLWNMGRQAALSLILETIDAVVQRYRGRIDGWIVANEVLDGSGLRTDVPWYETIGPNYVAESFNAAHAADPDALLVINEYGYETDYGSTVAADRRTATLRLLDGLLDADVPVHALGVQAHLEADHFAERFDASSYSRFLAEVADRGLRILITELDVLDSELPASVGERDKGVADTVSRYLDVTLAEPAVATLITFGLSDRYTWLEEDFPRSDGHPRRPLPFDERLRPKPMHGAVRSSLQHASPRDFRWKPPRC